MPGKTEAESSKTRYQQWLDVEDAWPAEWRDATSLDDELLELTAEQLQAHRSELGAVIGSYRGGPLRQDASEWPGRRSLTGADASR